MLMLEPASMLTLEVSRTLPLRFQNGNAGLNAAYAPEEAFNDAEAVGSRLAF